MTDTRFRCQCGRMLKAPAKLAGKQAKCPGCGRLVQVPPLAAPEQEPETFELVDEQPPELEGRGHQREEVPAPSVRPRVVPERMAARTARASSLPWEERKQIGVFSAFFQTLKLVLFAPSAPFGAMRETGGLGAAVSYLCIAGIVPVMIALGLLGLIFMRAQADPEGPIKASGLLVEHPGLLFVAIPIWPAMLIVGAFVQSAIMHFLLMICRAANNPFSATFRVLAYVGGSTLVLTLVPCCGLFICPLWAMVCGVIGLREAHQTTTGRVILAMALPTIILYAAAFIVRKVVGQ